MNDSLLVSSNHNNNSVTAEKHPHTTTTNPFKQHAIQPHTTNNIPNNHNNQNIYSSINNNVLLTPQNIKFPESWRSLGVILVSKDPTWSEWERKIIFLADTYLLECTNSKHHLNMIGNIY